MIACDGRASSRRDASQTCTNVTDEIHEHERDDEQADPQREPEEPDHAPASRARASAQPVRGCDRCPSSAIESKSGRPALVPSIAV